jgi:high-affinity iron transporter
MFVGVGLAVLLSVAVGIGLEVLSTSLPQHQQEMLETVVGAVAVVFVTTMIIWMNRNAMQLKGELEHEAAQAIDRGGSLALATMAFLAVLKEGFETAVFLLAAAQATHGNRWAAVVGAVAGIAVAIGIGAGIFFGGLKLNLGRFFRLTGIVLVLIAAGLVVSTLRAAHESGWIDIGQQHVFDFSSWMPARSVQGALITGMFGIPSDPRLIELLGWLLYTVPVLVVFLWPARLAAAPKARRNLLTGVAAGIATTALALVLLVPTESASTPSPSRTATLVDGATTTVTLTANGAGRSLTVDNGPPIALDAAGTQSAHGIDTQIWQASVPADPGVHTPTVSLAQLATLAGGRLPVGLGAARAPGPFDVAWQASTSYDVLSHGDSLVSARADNNRIAVLRGGGLTAAKTVSLGGMATDWTTAKADDDVVVASIAASDAERAERVLWRVWLPALLIVAAATTAWYAVRAWRRSFPTPHERTPIDDEPADSKVAVT